jgi:hypothetical protein
MTWPWVLIKKIESLKKKEKKRVKQHKKKKKTNKGHIFVVIIRVILKTTF